jgi:4,5-dihydroxyphthalate decarboxylase
LADGRVGVEGAEVEVIYLEPEECFWRMMRYAEFDISELSLSSYWIAKSHGDDRFVGVPVFLSRSFRHSSIYVAADGSVQEPADLSGRRVGVPEYQITAAVWTRGLLSDEYGVAAEDVTWVTGGLREPGRLERQPLKLSTQVRVERLEQDTLDHALRSGAIDALMSPRVPPSFRDDESSVRRLLPNYPELEKEYFLRTRIFPIMHLVVIRSEIHERHPWLAQSLAKAFHEAKRVAVEGIADAPALRLTLPFLLDTVEQQEAIFGNDPWPYGLEANRQTLATFSRYLVEQGLCSEPLESDELFAPSTRLASRV